MELIDVICLDRFINVANILYPEGVLVIGGQEILNQSPVWRTFIDKFLCVRSYLIGFYNWSEEYVQQLVARSYLAQKNRHR
ncbi:unnamed protein product [Enterobius vermicularis]|uniref:WecB/TagA/CpsF family glycosyltransferase n=1 Tax=Enterobius vermicularis TaxID=51028 RepID=A0A0N4UT85_ENTVE|nr:unnamed protein product [Enterobius vermicularis]